MPGSDSDKEINSLLNELLYGRKLLFLQSIVAIDPLGLRCVFLISECRLVIEEFSHNPNVLKTGPQSN